MSQFNGFPHVVRAQQFERKWLEESLFPEAEIMDRVNTMERAELKWAKTILRCKTMVQLFYEESTRTRASFSAAMQRLGGEIMFATENAHLFSSAAKGETLEDTIRVICQYSPDVIVLRHNEDEASRRAAEVSSVPIINAGDGKLQHPTQALLDIFTIKKELGRVDGIKIAMVGDLAKGRTVRSLCYLLGKFDHIHIYFVAPECSQMRDDIKEYLNESNVTFSSDNDLRRVAPMADVIYATRVQKERGSSFEATDRNLGYFTVDSHIMSLLNKNGRVMHPLPKVDEISPEVDSDPRAAYYRQVKNGLSVRMALLKIILTQSK